MSEAEATAIRFVIDHYEPRSARPDLLQEYTNLMYCCDECNLRKGDLIPPKEARDQGHRFFRADDDKRSEHFNVVGVRVEGASPVGIFTVDAMDLNRASLRRLRDLRSRLVTCDKFVAEGVFGLRDFPIDRLPKQIRGRAHRAIIGAQNVVNEIADSIDDLLRSHARSPLDGEDDSNEDKNLRLQKLKKLEGIFPGQWRSATRK